MGSLLGGIVIDTYRARAAQWLLAFSVLGSALSLVVYTFVTSFPQLLVLSFGHSLLIGISDNLVHILMIALCGDAVAPFMQSLHAGFAIGAFVAPAIATQFIEDDDTSTMYKWTFYTVFVIVFGFSVYLIALTWKGQGPFTEASQSSESSVHRSLSDSTNALSSEAAGIAPSEIEMMSTNDIDLESGSPTSSETSETSEPMESVRQTPRTFIGSTVIAISLCSVLLAFYVGAETALGSFLPAYAVKMDLMGESKAASLASIYWGSFAFGQLVAIPASMKVNVKHLILFSLSVGMVGVAGIAAFPQNTLVLWLLSATVGFAVSPLYASIITWLEETVELSGKTLSVICGLIAACEALFPLLAGLALSLRSGPRSMMFFLLGTFIFCSTIYACAAVYINNHSPSSDSETKAEADETDSIEDASSLPHKTAKTSARGERGDTERFVPGVGSNGLNDKNRMLPKGPLIRPQPATSQTLSGWPQNRPAPVATRSVSQLHPHHHALPRKVGEKADFCAVDMYDRSIDDDGDFDDYAEAERSWALTRRALTTLHTRSPRGVELHDLIPASSTKAGDLATQFRNSRSVVANEGLTSVTNASRDVRSGAGAVMGDMENMKGALRHVRSNSVDSKDNRTIRSGKPSTPMELNNVSSGRSAVTVSTPSFSAQSTLASARNGDLIEASMISSEHSSSSSLFVIDPHSPPPVQSSPSSKRS